MSRAFGVDRRAVLALLVLSGCGFAPTFGDKGAAQVLMGSVRAADPKAQDDFDFVARIEERLGRTEAVIFDLAYVVSKESEGVAITSGGEITRFNLTGRLDWTLTRAADGMRMAGGTETTFVGYSATGSTVAGLTARQDAGRRLMRILADKAVLAMTAAAPGFPA